MKRRTIGLLHLIEELSSFFHVFANLRGRAVDLRGATVDAGILPSIKRCCDVSHLLEEFTIRGRKVSNWIRI